MQITRSSVIRSLAVAVLAIGAGAAAPAAWAVDISGAGATFPYPVYAKWADAYKKATGVGLTISRSGPAAASSRFRPGRWCSVRPTPRSPVKN